MGQGGLPGGGGILAEFLKDPGSRIWPVERSWRESLNRHNKRRVGGKWEKKADTPVPLMTLDIQSLFLFQASAPGTHFP